MVTGLAACDNVAWEGVQVRIETPAAVESDAAADTLDEPAPPPPLDFGPLLFVVDRGETFDPADDRARILPVASLEDDGPRPLPGPDRVADLPRRLRTERMESGRRFTLFSGGRRVGTFVAGEDGSVDAGYCRPRPTAAGRIEVRPGAVGVERFLALPEEVAGDRPHAPFERIESARTQREASLDMAAAIFVTREIRWPPSVLGAREDVRVLRPEPGPDPVVAATFLYGDSLAVGEAPPTAYSLFFLGAEGENGRWEPTFVRYREVGVHGKEATRLVDHLDWDEDGADEVLLEVFGTAGRWFTGLTRDQGAWRESFDEGCDADAPPSREAGVAEGSDVPVTTETGSDSAG